MSSVAAVPSTQDLVLGRYRPMRPLGTGGSGSVWLALDERNGLDVALKIIPREGKAAARAEREALAARRLRHDRCVRAYDVGHDSEPRLHRVRVRPGTHAARDAFAPARSPTRRRSRSAAQVLDALAHAHRAGIVHRDVKPANILLEDRDAISVRLLDFGLAQFDGADTLTAVGDVPGTLAYIAPERLAGGDATPESDVWSVGVLLWETLSDRHPFWGMPIQEVARAIQAGAPPLATERRGLPRRLVAAVDTALALEPSARPSASDLAAELRNALRKPRERGAPGAAARSRETALPGTASRAPRSLRSPSPCVTAALGATLLPFWPPVLVAAIAVAAGLACWVDPRLGLALALAAPIFPLGNVAASAAFVYGVFALGWLVADLARRTPRAPLRVRAAARSPRPASARPARRQRAQGTVRRAAQGALPPSSRRRCWRPAADGQAGLGIDAHRARPRTTVHARVERCPRRHRSSRCRSSGWQPPPAPLPWVRRRTPYGVGAIGFVLDRRFRRSAEPASRARSSSFSCWAGAGVSSALARRS